MSMCPVGELEPRICAEVLSDIGHLDQNIEVAKNHVIRPSIQFQGGEESISHSAVFFLLYPFDTLRRLLPLLLDAPLCRRREPS